MLYSAIFILVAKLLFSFGLLHSKPNSLNRYFVISLIAVCCFTATRSPLIQKIPGLIGLEYTIGFLFHSVRLLCLTNPTPPKDSLSSKSRLNRWAFNQAFSFRWGDNTLASIRPLPWRSFLEARLWDTVWLSAILILNSQWHPYIHPDDFHEVPNGFLTRIHSVRPREAIIRIYIYLTSTFIPYIVLRLCHSIASIVAVLSGDQPSNWPPLFGSIGEAYTIRNFYS